MADGKGNDHVLSSHAVLKGCPLVCRLLLVLLNISFFALFAVPAYSVQQGPGRDGLVIGVLPKSAPLSFLDLDRNKLTGLAVELSMDMADSMRTKISFIQSNARKLEQKLKQGEIDAIVGLLPVNLESDFYDVLVTPLALNRTRSS